MEQTLILSIYGPDPTSEMTPNLRNYRPFLKVLKHNLSSEGVILGKMPIVL